MKNICKTIWVIFFVLFNCNISAQNKKIIVFGSSVASGWVTNYQKQYDMQNGWAFRLQRYLNTKGWEVTNSSKPGDNTNSALKRIREDLLIKKPEIAIISLSLSNEGLTDLPSEEVINGFIAGIKAITDSCIKYGIKPILGYCYANNDYNKEHFEAIKNANTRLEQFGYPCIDFLGAFSDEEGHFINGHTFEGDHPDNYGHEEMYLSIVPSIFDAIFEGKNIHSSIEDTNYLRIGINEKINSFYYVPDNILHSFSIILEMQEYKDFRINIKNTKTNILVNFDGIECKYLRNNKLIAKKKCLNGKHQVALVYSNCMEKLAVYLDGIPVIMLHEKLEPIQFSFSSKSVAACKNLFIYRSALSVNNLINLDNNKIISASLDLYSDLGKSIQNLALSNTALYLSDKQARDKSDILKILIQNADIERKKTPIFKEKKPIRLSTQILNKYIGSYFSDRKEEMRVYLKDGKMVLNAFGNEAELIPESKNVFFIRYPGEITITFNETGNNLDLNLMGNHIIADRK
ncbi:MAG: SGNH/GDSL hydrolase family protein [bacterium]